MNQSINRTPILELLIIIAVFIELSRTIFCHILNDISFLHYEDTNHVDCRSYQYFQTLFAWWFYFMIAYAQSHIQSYFTIYQIFLSVHCVITLRVIIMRVIFLHRQIFLPIVHATTLYISLYFTSEWSFSLSFTL